MNLDSKILVTGHRGLIGSEVVRLLKTSGHTGVITVARSEVDLCSAPDVKWLFSAMQPEYVIHCAARVGGVKDNRDHPLEFLNQNLDSARNTIMNAQEYGCKKFLMLGSSCIYPRDCAQPMVPGSLLSGPFEASVEAYGISKVFALKLCQYLRKERGFNAISLLPCNVYGPGADFDPERAHVVPGIMGRMHAAKMAGDPTFSVWGKGEARREMIFVTDLARAILLAMEKYDEVEPLNAGSGEETKIVDLAHAIAGVVGYAGEIVFDPEKPEGVSKKLMNSSPLRKLGWEPLTSLRSGLRATYDGFLAKKRAESVEPVRLHD